MASAVLFAELVARPIDRAHIAASNVPSLDELLAIQGYDVSPGHAAPVVAFLAQDGMSWAELKLPLRYAPDGRIRDRLNFCTEHGAITFEDDWIEFTPAGRLAAAAALDARAVALDEKWANTPKAVGDLLELLGPVADRARQAAKLSSTVHDATVTTPNSTRGSQLWLLLANVRRFRADCHAEAWTEAGHTVESIVALAKDAPTRRPIEARTNELNAEIWADLNTNDQLRCLAALASLDGSGTPT